MSVPVDVAYVRAERLLRVTWDDDFVADLPAEYLRAWCPCAACQGHAATIRYRPTGDRQAVEAMWQVGAYAIGLKFTDGHDSGVYTWQWLRQIAPGTPPLGLKTGAFHKGNYTPVVPDP